MGPPSLESRVAAARAALIKRLSAVSMATETQQHRMQRIKTKVECRWVLIQPLLQQRTTRTPQRRTKRTPQKETAGPAGAAMAGKTGMTRMPGHRHSALPPKSQSICWRRAARFLHGKRRCRASLGKE